MQKTFSNRLDLSSTKPHSARRIQRAVFLLLGGLLLAATAGIGNAQRPNGSGEGHGLKVMTWNVAGGRCGTDRAMSPFAQVIRAHSPDVVAIQEVHLDQAARLARATGLQLYFVQTLDCRDQGPDFGMAILSRYPFEENSRKIYLLPNHPLDTRRREFRKMAGVSINVDGRRIRIYNTHLTAIGSSGDFFNPYRFLQATSIRDFILEDQGSSGNTILMGDFNSQPGTLVYRLLRGTFRDANPGGNTTVGGTRVDYIFVGGTDLRIDDSGVLNTGRVSDHFPVITRLSFNELNS